MRNLLKIFLLATFVLIFLFFYKGVSSAQTCGSYSCGTNIETCTPSGCDPNINPVCICTTACVGSSGTYSCNFSSTYNICVVPPGVNECGGSSNACITSPCPAPVYPSCNGGASCGPWSVECGSASRTCTYTTYSGGGSCTQNSYTDTTTLTCPATQYCSTNTCHNYGSIDGHVYIDSNMNGTVESGASGVGVDIAPGGSTTTGSSIVGGYSGYYNFSTLTQGTYTVSRGGVGGYITKCGTSSSYSVNVGGGNSTQNFWISDVSSIDVNVIKDWDHNGATDATDDPFAGVDVAITGDCANGATNSTTNIAGNVTKSGLTWGNHTVSITVPNGWALSSGTASRVRDVGQTDTTVNFYLTRLYTIDLGAYVDNDNNLSETTAFPHGAERAYGRAGDTDLVIKLMQSGSEIKRATISNGTATIIDVKSGNYNLVFDDPSGFEFRSIPITADCSPPSCRGTITDPANFLTTGPDNNKSRDYIFSVLHTITAHVYRNSVGGPVYSGGADITLKQSGSTLKTTSTNLSGIVIFADYLTSAPDYTVALDVPLGFTAIKQGNQTCSPPNCQGVVNDPTTLDQDRTVNFVISSTQFCTVNGDVKDEAGQGVPGVLINLSGDAVANDTTDASGVFSFGPYQDPSSLTTTMTVPNGYSATNGTVKPAGVCPDTNIHYVIKGPEISGHVFNDNNGDGVKNGADTDKSGVTVALLNGPTSKPSVQSGSGAINPYNYTFQNLTPGTYTVRITVPNTFQATNGNCSVSNPNCTGTTSRVVTVGPDATNINFGLQPLDITCTSLCCFVGTVRVDGDFDGQPDRTYGGGTNVNLRHGGVLDGTDVTNTGGKYAVNTNNANTYRVQLAVPAGYNAASTNPVTNLVCNGPSQIITTDFLIQPPGCTISGNVYTDTNGNGVKDAGETGRNGMTVTVGRSGGGIVGSPTTNPAGNYTTTETSGYSYNVSITEPTNFDVSTPPNPKSVNICPNATANFGLTPVPAGNLDSATCANWGGWACDASNYNTALTVQFYANGPVGGGGSLVGSTTANTSRADLGGVCGGVLTHAFNFSPVPSSLQDGQSHTIYAYGVDTPTGNFNPLLGGSPKTIKCASGAVIISSPPGCTINPNATTCSTTITWSYTAPSAEVCVATPGNAPVLFAAGGAPIVNHSKVTVAPPVTNPPLISAANYTFTVRSVPVPPAPPIPVCTGAIIPGGTTTITGTQTYKVTGNVYVDTNGNGVKDAGEGNYPGAQITNTCAPSVATDASGNYTTYPPTQINATPSCTVSLSVPVGYAVSTANPRSVTLGPNATVNFGIRPSHSVTADAFEDTGLDNCSAATRTHYGGKVSFALTDTDTGLTTNSVPLSINPPYIFSNMPPDNQSLSMSVPSGYRMAGVSINSAPATLSGNSVAFVSDSDKTVDFCITNAVSWFQVNQGDVRYPTLVDKVPSGKAAGVSGDSVFISSNAASDFGSGGTAVGNPNKWLIDNEYSTLNSAGKNSLGSFSYEFYKDRAAKNGVTITSLPSVAAASDCVPNGSCVLPVLPTGIYEVNGSLTILGTDAPQIKHVVLLVSGNIMIKGDITTDVDPSTGKHGLFILATKTDLTIDKTVGSAANSATFNLSGFYSAEGNIVADGDGTAQCAGGTADKRLNIEGAIIANALYPFSSSGGGGVTNNRSLCANDINYPSLYVAMQPKFFTQLTDFYKVTNKRWMQVQP